MRKKYRVIVALLLIMLLAVGCQKEEVKETPSNEVATVENDEYSELAEENILLKREVSSIQAELRYYENCVMANDSEEFVKWATEARGGEFVSEVEEAEEQSLPMREYVGGLDKSEMEIVIEPIEDEREMRIAELTAENDRLNQKKEKLQMEIEMYKEILGIGMESGEDLWGD